MSSERRQKDRRDVGKVAAGSERARRDEVEVVQYRQGSPADRTRRAAV